ncbi:hypothetical protein UCRNP2_1389 [Neofusicoccum parvum UCRNP2]|uniref:Uncharacterized protein n=1 Tax=Botryosphaeria parva (strain UCR-NP2) TaxID=1287680 RepID=R1H088_BOTPV|nr:hypothetical protein UCRNP2_1389 [Neofusicoccum parvum UCRNP2]
MPEPGEQSQATKRRSIVVDGGKDETEPGMPTTEEKLNATASLRPGRKVNDAAINYILAFLSAPFAEWEAVNSLNLKPGCTWRKLALLHSLLRAALGRVDDLGVQEGELHNDAEQLRKIE